MSHVKRVAALVCFCFKMMTDWLDQLPQIDAAIADAEWRIEKQREFLTQKSHHELLASEAEGRGSLELMLMLAGCLRGCRTAMIARSMSTAHTRH